MKKTVDKPLLFSIITLVIAGFFIFSSASLGLLARGGNLYSNAAFSQTFFGLLLGSIAMMVTSRIPYKNWRKFAFPLFVLSMVVTSLVFVPGIGFEHGGAKRWLMFAGQSIQPSEFLKIGFIIYFAAWASVQKERIGTFKEGLLPFLIIIGLVGFLLLLQPDTDTFMVTFFAGLAMFLTAGGKWKHAFLLIACSVIGILIIASFRPYVKQRITTFVNPNANGLTSGYQIQQSLIAIGSGGLTGRGFGQSIQKFEFLPEPIGDSIYAVASEEFGFLGAVLIILFFVIFAFRGLKIAARTDDLFGRLLVVGIVILIVSQAFVNIGAMIGVLPLTGIPLPFVSHGGTALLITLAVVGIILNISKYHKKV